MNTLTELMKATGQDKRGRSYTFKRIKRKWPEHVIDSRKGKRGKKGTPSELWITPEGYKTVLAALMGKLPPVPPEENTLSKLLEETGYHTSTRGKVYRRIRTKWPHHVIDWRKGKCGKNGTPSELWITPDGYKEVLLHYMRSMGRVRGWIYCFLANGFTQDGSNWLKIGRAETLKKRLRAYTGPAGIRRLIGIFEVDSMKEAEDHMLAGFRQVFENRKSSREWFVIPQDRLPEAKKLFVKLFESLEC
jgi:hypothetical protein